MVTKLFMYLYMIPTGYENTFLTVQNQKMHFLVSLHLSGVLLTNAAKIHVNITQTVLTMHRHTSIVTYIGDSTAVAVYSLCFQGSLFNASTQRLIIILRVQDKLAWIFCGSLEERHVWVKPPAKE